MQSRAAKQREIAGRTASGKGGNMSPRSRAQKRDLCLLRERARESQHSKRGSRECKGPDPGLYLGEQAGQHLVLIEERDEL